MVLTGILNVTVQFKLGKLGLLGHTTLILDEKFMNVPSHFIATQIVQQ